MNVVECPTCRGKKGKMTTRERVTYGRHEDCWADGLTTLPDKRRMPEKLRDQIRQLAPGKH